MGKIINRIRQREAEAHGHLTVDVVREYSRLLQQHYLCQPPVFQPTCGTEARRRWWQFRRRG